MLLPFARRFHFLFVRNFPFSPLPSLLFFLVRSLSFTRSRHPRSSHENLAPTWTTLSTAISLSLLLTSSFLLADISSSANRKTRQLHFSQSSFSAVLRAPTLRKGERTRTHLGACRSTPTETGMHARVCAHMHLAKPVYLLRFYVNRLPPCNTHSRLPSSDAPTRLFSARLCTHVHTYVHVHTYM